MMEWLPDFALKYSEQKMLRAHNAVENLRRAASHLYKSEKFKRRGEFGELLLHIAIRSVFQTVPAISKMYYKSAHNDTVKGFDAVHVVCAADSIELWLGESKFYKDIRKAINDVVAELAAHLEQDYLRGEFALITNKVDDDWPHAERLKRLLHPNVSLDEVFDQLCIPVFLTYESSTVRRHRIVSAEYELEFRDELIKHKRSFAAHSFPNVVIRLFLLPLASKEQLLRLLDEKLKVWQNI